MDKVRADTPKRPKNPSRDVRVKPTAPLPEINAKLGEKAQNRSKLSQTSGQRKDDGGWGGQIVEESESEGDKRVCLHSAY